MINLKSIKTQLALYLASFALYLYFKDKDAAFLMATCIAVISAAIIESFILYYKNKVFEITESSIISGLIIGFVISSDEAWWKFFVAAALAIIPKYFIRFRNKHLFNPAGFGIFATLILFNTSAQWKGTFLWYILVPFGLYFAYRFRKLEIIVGYAIIFLVLFGTQAFIQEIPFKHIFGFLSYFYIFIMVIEPKTTPLRGVGKLIFGASVAALIFVLTNLGAKFDVELLSLLLMNITVPLLNRII